MKSEFPGYVYGHSHGVFGEGSSDSESRPNPIVYGLNHQVSRNHLLSRGRAEKGQSSVAQRSLFASQWPDPRSQDIAWALRSLLNEQLERPSDLLLNPSDPMAVWPSSCYDSLDELEFIVTVESVFRIEIPDEDSVRWFTSMTLCEAVDRILQSCPAEATAV